MHPSGSASQHRPPEPSSTAPTPPWITRAAPRTGAARATEPAEASRLTAQDVAAARRAARYAQHAYGGPVGDLIGRELRAYTEAGEQRPPHAMGPRLVSMLMKQEARHPLPLPRTDTHLPAKYVPGTSLRWRCRFVADVEESAAGSS
jgi:hypothetical protein